MSMRFHEAVMRACLVALVVGPVAAGAQETAALSYTREQAEAGQKA